MRIFCGVLSIQTGIISLVAEYLSINTSDDLSLVEYSTRLTHYTSYFLSLGMIIAGLLIIIARNSIFLVSLAILIWSFSLIFNILFVPSYTGIHFRTIISVVCLIMGLSIYVSYVRR